jgi:hypothetical protein
LAVIVWVPVPTIDGVYDPEHDADAPVPVRVQILPAKDPSPLLLKDTDPDGVVGIVEVSVTVAVQVDGEPIGTLAGAHETVVLVVLRVPVTVAAALVLVA